MAKDGYLPQIITAINDHEGDPLCTEMVEKILHHVVPENFFIPKENEFSKKLPIFNSKMCRSTPGNLTLYIFGNYKKHALKFLIEMLSNWLIPGNSLNLTKVFSSEFSIPYLKSSTTYMACEIIIPVNSIVELDHIRNNLPIIESEIFLGMNSSFYAKRILELKGLASDAKTALIQEKITYLLEKKPQYFEFDLLTEMQHILVICRDEFKSQRCCSHLIRIIAIQYFFRKSLSAKLQIPNKRHVLLKIFRSQLQVENGKKNVLSIVVGINFLKKKEFFEKRHLLGAIKTHMSDVKAIENSYFEDRRSLEDFCLMYLEIEKSTGEKFNQKEIAALRKTLPALFLDSVEQMMHPVFMPRNEEEVMRNILSLSAEVKFLRDLPQVMLIFDEQTYSKLTFTTIAVRILQPGDASIEELFKKNETFLTYIHDRCKTIAYLRNKYIKEATVFRVQVDKSDFIRKDQSIDLNKTRQAIACELLNIIGEFRDFNGGMILKQNELLAKVKLSMLGEANFNELLFENFFFSITPTAMRTVLEPQIVKTLFLTLQEALEMEFKDAKNYLLHVVMQPSHVFVIIKSDLPLNSDEITRALGTLQVKSSDMAIGYVQVHDIHYNGYMFHCMDLIRQEQFVSIIHHTLARMFTLDAVSVSVSNAESLY